jgi:hypothetical protein
MQSSLKRGIGSGLLYPQAGKTEWPVAPRYDEDGKTAAQIMNDQRKAKEMLHTLACEVYGLNKDRENLRHATENADKAHKKTTDYLAPVNTAEEGVKVTTEGMAQVEPPEEPFLKILSPSKPEPQAEAEGEGDERMRTPTRKINYGDSEDSDNFRDSERVLELSPPMARYNPSLMQNTFDLYLDGITLQELEQMKKQNEHRLKNIEKQFFEANGELETDVKNMTEYTKDDQYLIKVIDQVVNVPINSLAELNADMLNLDTNESEADDQGHHFSKRLIYELKFEKYLKGKIKDEIIRREKVRREKYIAPEELERLEKKSKVEEMVRIKLEGKTLTPEEEERLRLINQGRIDCDDAYLIIIKQIFNDLLDGGENENPNQSDDDSYEVRPVESVDKNKLVQK